MPPIPVTPLLGRERELEETSRLLETTRLLTITGAGGSGKTRLALELSHRLGNRYDGRVYWVDLQSITEPALVEEQILDALSIRDAPAMGAMQLIIDQLRDDKVLLVLDNCEHVIHAAAVAAEAILRGCSRATILTTTREALGIAGEQTWLVPPLSVQDATQLFAERARAVVPSFVIDAQNADAVARICNRLDGIPLAIELAAARVKVLTVEQILERLSDAFRLLSSGSRTLPRHRTIHETIDWSYRLLSPDEQELLRLLAVFAGTFTLEAAEAVCGRDVLTHLSALVDKSLVLFDTRYRLLETVRQFAVEKLAQSGALDAMRERHARYFLEMLEAAEPRIFAGTIDAPTLARIDEEIGNVRVAFDWAEEDPSRAEIELRMLYALHWYWFARGHFHEARRHAEHALKRAQHVDPMIHARAQIAFGNIAVWQADWNAIRAPLEEAVATLRGTSDLSVLSVALTLLGTAYAFAEKDDYLASKTLAEAKEMGKRHGRGLGLACYWSGVAAQLRGDWSVARAELEQCRAIGEQRGVPPAIAHANTVLGFVALHEKKRSEAIDCFRRALDMHARIDDRWGLTQVIEGVGLLLLEDGAAEIGTRLLAAASAAWLNLGARPGRDAEFERQKDARIRRALGDDRLRIIFASGAAMPYDTMVALAREQLEQLASTPAPSQLRVRALGAIEIERDGESVEGERRARELLLFLLTQQKGATKEQIGAALWPGVDASRIRNNFHVTLHRLRKMLGGPEWISIENETYRIDRKNVDFDVEAFEAEARAAIRSGNAAHLARAAAIYRGDFMEHTSGEGWYEDVRDRLRELYGEVLAALGRVSSDPVDALERLFALNPTNEENARNLMKALEKRGEKARAQRVYKRLESALAAIGEKPGF
jgi:predicted ATPase/DNA-binding SARP family transcriptional activator